ncbi:MAG: hypothetical protein KDA05_01850 [Phycisphaerales bacterium]|nr:hypothetical protein [Phycisphaerales bacterium]MCB9840954.1 hypothetical protein [Phycisphaeraceae bacterium]
MSIRSRSIRAGRRAGAFALAGALASTTTAEVLPIINPGFESVSRPLAVGEITNGAGGAGVPVGTRPNLFAGPQFASSVEVEGWRSPLPPPMNPNATIRVGVLNPHEVQPGVPYLSGYTGTHVAWGQVAPMQQTLPVFIQPSTTYRLTFLAGFGRFETQEGVYVGLYGAPDLETPVYNTSAGSFLAQTQGIIPPLASAGQMLPYSLEVTTPAVLPTALANRYIAIAFVGSDGIPSMAFDDFRLEATPVPGPPAIIALTGAAALAGRRRHGSFEAVGTGFEPVKP